MDADVVADSFGYELFSLEELELFPELCAQNVGDLVNTAANTSEKLQTVEVSEVSYFTENPISNPAKSLISSFTPSTPATKSRPRPRPRPAYKGAPEINSSGSSHITSASRTLTSPTCKDSVPENDLYDHGCLDQSYNHSMDIAERAKTRSRHASKTAAPSSSPRPARRKRSRADGSSPSKQAFSTIVIDLSSDDDYEDEDELALRPAKKSKSKPKPKSKPKQSARQRISKKSTKASPNASKIANDTSVASPDHPLGTQSSPISEERLNSDVPKPHIDLEKKRKGRKRETGANLEVVVPAVKGRVVLSAVQEANHTANETEKQADVALQKVRGDGNGDRTERKSPAKSGEATNDREMSEPDDTTPKENRSLDIEVVNQNMPPPSSKAHYRSPIISRTKPTPMTELIRRVNSLPGSPFPGSPGLVRGCSAAPSTMTAYSPYLKASRSALSRIAPLHPNRRPPPPPLPRPPPPKKTKKQLEREEKWEEELSESVEGWACMTDEERAMIRRAKRDREEGWDE